MTAGLTWPGIVWAFQSGDAANWHPLTWISHMLDCQLYGLNPGGHHLTNLLFHIANTLLLFLWLERLTGALWRSALVAALVRLASVARGIGRLGGRTQGCVERVFLDADAYRVHAYVTGDKWQVTRRSRFATVTYHPSLYYGLALFFFACGLMSKPMVVTLPFVLLLLDFWPLGA